MSLQVKYNSLSVCRICLDAKCKDRVKFDVESEWSRMFVYCVGLPITAEKAPLEFCQVCAEKLQDYEKFKKRCLKSEALWKSTLSEVKSVSANYKPEVIKDEPMYEEYLSDHSYNDEVLYSSDVPVKSEDNNSISNGIDIKAKCEVKLERLKNNLLIEISRKEKDDKNFKEICILEGSLPKPTKIKTRGKKKCLLRRSKRRNGIKKIKLEKSTPIKLMVPKSDVAIKAEVDIKPAKPPKVVEPVSFDCGICEFTSTKFESLKQHFNEHIASNDLSCKLCDYIGRDSADMAQHRYNHIPASNGKHYCPSCSKRFQKQLGLQFHYRAVHLKKKGGLCTVCNKGLACYRAWKRHEKMHVMDRKEKYICDICGVEAQYRCSMIVHLREHSDIKDFICDTCGRGFKRMTNLRSHIENMHTPSVPVTCTHCNRVFKNEANLKIHMRQESKEKKYICDVCSKGYPSVATLQSHMFWHTGERPFSCELCGSKYKANSQLKIHLRSHSDYRPYKCSVCDKGFTSSNSLKRHHSVHTGVRSNKCLYCDRTFHSKSQMVAHCMSRHKVTIVTTKSD